MRTTSQIKTTSQSFDMSETQKERHIFGYLYGIPDHFISQIGKLSQAVLESSIRAKLECYSIQYTNNLPYEITLLAVMYRTHLSMYVLPNEKRIVLEMFSMNGRVSLFLNALLLILHPANSELRDDGGPDDVVE